MKIKKNQEFPSEFYCWMYVFKIKTSHYPAKMLTDSHPKDCWTNEIKISNCFVRMLFFSKILSKFCKLSQGADI